MRAQARFQVMTNSKWASTDMFLDTHCLDHSLSLSDWVGESISLWVSATRRWLWGEESYALFNQLELYDLLSLTNKSQPIVYTKVWKIKNIGKSKIISRNLSWKQDRLIVRPFFVFLNQQSWYFIMHWKPFTKEPKWWPFTTILIYLAGVDAWEKQSLHFPHASLWPQVTQSGLRGEEEGPLKAAMPQAPLSHQALFGGIEFEGSKPFFWIEMVDLSDQGSQGCQILKIYRTIRSVASKKTLLGSW